MPKHKPGKKAFSWRNFLSSCLLFVAIAALFYPLIANLLASRQTVTVVEKFVEKSETLTQQERDRLLDAAHQYNAYLFAMSQRKEYQGEIPEYDDILKVDDNGMMGYLYIPQIDLQNLPIYHGVEDKELDAGIGHIPQTSFPIGGKNTHAVLSAHSGRANNTLFSNLEKLQQDDAFYIDVLDARLKYKVIDTQVVEPDEVESLSIQADKDLVTLVTCYPIGINSHRLLVTGERTAYEEETPTEEIKRNQYGYDFWVLLGSSVLVLIASSYLIYKRMKRKGKRKRTS